jgi:hypothetical protein
MLALRYAAVLAVAVWIGGLVALGGVAAPAIFDVVAATHTADARMAAGAIFGEAFRRFHFVALGCAGIVLLSLAARALLGPRPRHFAFRGGIGLLMLAATLYSGFVMSPAVRRAQVEIGAAPSSLPEGDPRRAAFGRLHAQSSALQIVPIVGGLLLMFWDIKDQH